MRHDCAAKSTLAQEAEARAKYGSHYERYERPHRIPISGATTEDIALVAHSVDMIFHMAIGGLMGVLENLSENLPLDAAHSLDTKGIYQQIYDLRSETLGRLEELGERS